MLAKATQLSSPPAEDASMSASKVLGDDDLLGEIVHRVDSPASLVSAALVSKRWLGAASDLLCRFRASRQPRLLGFFVSGDCMQHPEFVPMPTSQPVDTELGAAICRASFHFGAFFPEVWSYVWDCRSGRVLFEISEVVNGVGVRRLAVRAPGEDVAVLQPLPPDLLRFEPHALLLPADDGDGTSCYIVGLDQSGPQVTAQVVALRSGAWTLLCSAEAVLPAPPDRIPMLTAFAAGKIYTVAVAGYILGLDMAAAAFFVIELPDGAAYEYYGNLVPCRGDDGSVLYLFHLKGDQLCVWLRRMVGEPGAGEWVLRDTISLQETCGHLTEHGRLEPAAGHTALASVVGVGDNAEFVFLELEDGGIFVCIHLNSRKVEKVYQRDPDNDEITLVFPCSMVWPPNPIFPTLT